MTPIRWEAQDERLVDSREHYTFNEPDAPGGKFVTNPHYRGHVVGDVVTHFVSAPGTGHVRYRITRVDDKGAWGVIVESTVRELTEGDVR